MQYKEYLKSEHWKDLRQKKIIKGNSVCAFCGCLFSDVHHINYKKLFDVKTEDLRLACRDCHYTIHKLEKEGFIKYSEDFKTSHNSRYGSQYHALLKHKYDIFYNIRVRVYTGINTILKHPKKWQENPMFFEMIQREGVYKYAYSLRNKQLCLTSV